MAWTNVKDEALPRVAKLARLMRCSDREALGTIAFCWRNSQDILQLEGSRDEVLEWAHLEGEEPARAEEWLLAMQRARFISPTAGGMYLIRGNDTELEARNGRTKGAHKGGEKNRLRWEQIKAERATREGLAAPAPEVSSVPSRASGYPEDSSEQSSRNAKGELELAHCTALQGTALQKERSSSALRTDAHRAVAAQESFPEALAVAAPRFDYESVYRLYPNKVGKKRGMKEVARQVRTAAAFEAFRRAVEHYAAYQKRPLGVNEFRAAPKQFDTFMADDVWPDWVDPDEKLVYGPRGKSELVVVQVESASTLADPPKTLADFERELATQERENPGYSGYLRRLVEKKRAAGGAG